MAVGWRGILPSVGAGTSLIVAGVLGLAVVSSIIAFRGFPGLGPDVARPPVQLAMPAPDRDGAARPIIVGAGPQAVSFAAPAERVVRRRARSERAARTQRGVSRAVSSPASPSPRSPSPTTPSPTSPAPRSPSPSTSSPKTPSPSAPASASPQPVRNTVDQVRNLVPPPPPAPQALQPVADTVNDTVDQAAGVVDDTINQATGVVGGLLP